MGLREYGRKRRFDVTPEPAAKRAKSPARRGAAKLRFVVQKHQASHLHYDFRLEWGGVLLSWAVPKGPSLNPRVKRLAVAVEDHPVEYARFESVIPEGQYGGGTVMIWDHGTYEPADADVGRSLAAGEIKFVLHGQKLRGAWVLVRTGPPDSKNWLLIKRTDEESARTDIVAEAPRSVVSKRSMRDIALDEGGDVDRAARADPPSRRPEKRSAPAR